MRIRAILIAAVLALLAGPALAQMMPGISLSPEERKLTPEEKERQEAIDRDYKAALQKQRTADKPKAKDPWGNIRSGSAGKQGQ